MKCRLLTFALSAMAVAPALAASPRARAAVPPPDAHMNFAEIFKAGGLCMYPLLLLSVATIALAFMLAFTLRVGAIASDRFMEEMSAKLRARDFSGALDYCKSRSEVVARVMQKALETFIHHPGIGKAEVRDSAETEGSRQAGLLATRTGYLGDIGTVAPLVGLLGTVIGMINAFLDLSRGEQGVKQMQLSSGISEALVATASGLVIAVPAMVFYAIYRARTQRRIADMESAASHLLNLLPSQPEAPNPETHPAHFKRDEFAMPVAPALRDGRDLIGI